MPLIIGVVLIIWIFVVVHDKNKDQNRKNANYEKARRKTNAEKERIVLDGYMKQGMTLAEAYEATKAEMIRLGYEPCIPLNAYGTDLYGRKEIHTGEETSYLEAESNRFDSDEVKTRKRLLEKSGKQSTDENVYSGFPNNNVEFEQNLKRQTLQFQSIPVGEWITYPGYGTLEILGYEYSTLNTSKGYYKAKVIKTGEIVTTIEIGDKSIRRVNSKFN